MEKRISKLQQTAIIFMFVAYGVLAVIAAWRAWVFLRFMWPKFLIQSFLILQFVLCALLPVGFFLPHSKFSKRIQVIGRYWVSFQITFFFTAVADLALSIVLVRLFKVISEYQFSYISAVLFSITTVLTVYGIIHVQKVYITKYDCTVKKANFSGKNLRIVQLSDLHLSAVNDLNTIKKIVDQVNGLNADLICITGDTFTENTREIFEPDEIAAEFRGLKSNYGVFTCLGNHDSGFDLPNMLLFFQKADIKILEDEYVEYGGGVLLGRVDRFPGDHRKEVAECLKTVNRENLIVVMDHQPGDIENTRDAQVDILLSGHTHGGQFYPLNRFIQKIFPHYYGCKKYGNMYSIVSSGTCTPIPHVRVMGRSEIVLVNITGE